MLAPARTWRSAALALRLKRVRRIHFAGVLASRWTTLVQNPTVTNYEQLIVETSFAAALISAAVLAEHTKQTSVTYSSILSALRSNADSGFVGYNTTQFGPGIVHV